MVAASRKEAVDPGAILRMRQATSDLWRYVRASARKPGALRNGAPFKGWVLPAAIKRIRCKLAGTDDDNRPMVSERFRFPTGKSA